MLDARNPQSTKVCGITGKDLKINKFGIFKDIKNYIEIISLWKTSPNGGKKTQHQNQKTHTPPRSPQKSLENNTARVGHLLLSCHVHHAAYLNLHLIFKK